MHIYIYDSALSQNKFLKEVHDVEAKITDLGLNGRVCRLGRLRSLVDIMREELRRAPKTIIAVGDDNLISQVISLMGGSHVALGIIPVGEANSIATSLGITAQNACNVLSARRLIEVDLGLVDNRAFVRRAEIFGCHKVLVDGNYYLYPEADKIDIFNILMDEGETAIGQASAAASGSLYLSVTKEVGNFLKKEVDRSLVPFRELHFDSDDAEAVLDGLGRVRRPQRVTIMPKGLELIVGRERQF